MRTESSPKTGKRHTERHDYILVDSEADLEALFAKLMQEKEICIDTETTNHRPMVAELVGIGFCSEPGHAAYLPCNGNLGQEKVLCALRDFFERYTRRRLRP